MRRPRHPAAAQDTSQGGKIVTFCTGVRSGDVLMPMWCGTDYDNELAMKASTYYNMCAALGWLKEEDSAGAVCMSPRDCMRVVGRLP